MVPPQRLKSLQSSNERGGNDLFIIIFPQAIFKSWENDCENEMYKTRIKKNLVWTHGLGV